MSKLLWSLICFLLFLPTLVSAETIDMKQQQQKVLSTATGRYVFGQVSEYRRDQYLLDTQTGRLWAVVSDKEGNSKLQPMPFIQIWGDEAYIPDPQAEADEHRKLVRKKTTEEINKLLENDKPKKK